MLFFSALATAQYNHPHQHNGNWHTHPHSAAHYHNYWGNVTYYPPTSTYRGMGIWSYSPGAVVGPNRNVIIGFSGGYYYYPGYYYYNYNWCNPYYRR
jgi:hypothetical protein